MEDHEAIPTLRPSHKRALEFFARNEFRELAYGLPKKIEQNALDSLRELEDKTVRSQLKFVGYPKQGTLKRSDKRLETYIRKFSEVESLAELEALGGVVTDANGYCYPINKLRCNRPDKVVQKPVHPPRKHSVSAGFVEFHRFKNAKKSALRNLQDHGFDVSKKNTKIQGELNNFPQNASVACDENFNQRSSDIFILTEPSCEQESLPDINSFSDTADVLAMLEDQT